jgi:nitrate/nitrite transport system ATP-binding protein
LELRNISKIYLTAKGARHVLHRVNLSVEEGEFVSIVGYSASGKTTLVNIASGLLTPTSGEVFFNGQPLAGFRPEVGVVFQNYSLLPWFSALENVRLAVEAAYPSWTAAKCREQAVKYLEMVGLGKALQKRPKQLSGGMRQRVAIARAFAIEPRVLFLDEPFGALDALTRGTLQQELTRLCSEVGRTVTTLMITNSVDEAILLSDRILPMTRAPQATLGTAVPVALERPRTAAALLHDEKAVRIHSQIVGFLSGFAGSSGGQGTALASPAPIASARAAGAEGQL